MPAFFYFLIKMMACSAILFVYYHCCLRNKIYHAYNRFYLLAATLVSMLAPLVNFQLLFSNEAGQAAPVQWLRAVNSSDEYLQEVIIYSGSRHAANTAWFTFLYVLVSLGLLLAFGVALFKIFWLIRQSKPQALNDISFVESSAKGTPFSFFRYIFWNSAIDLQSETGKRIFLHELAHVRQKHSADKIYIQLLLIIFWINPVFWFIKKELQLLHEFIADKKAIEDNDAGALAAMIIQSTYPQHSYLFTNPFFYSPIKRRIKMLTKYQNKKANYLYRILGLPVLLFAIGFISIKAKTKITAMVANPASTQVSYNAPTTYQAFIADTIPGKGLGTYKGRAIKHIRVKVANGQTEVELDNGKKYKMTMEEAMKAGINIPPPPPPPPAPPPAPNFTAPPSPPTPPSAPAPPTPPNDAVVAIAYPNATSKSIPANTDASQHINGNLLSTTLAADKQPLYVLEGKEISVEALQNIAPDDIESIQVTKANTAKASQYSNPKAANGVIEIFLKDPGPITRDANGSQHITASKMLIRDKQQNVLYLGVENIIQITDAKQELMLLLRNSSGQLKQVPAQQNTWKASFAQPGQATLVVTNKQGTVIKQFNFLIEPLKATEKEYGSFYTRLSVAEDDNKVFTRVEEEASFPGGAKAWRDYLKTHLNANKPLEEGWANGTYTIMLRLLVDKVGNIKQVIAESFPESKTAAHCIEVIKKGPKWLPARQNGRQVNAYRRQPITFVIAEKKDRPTKPETSK